jgi:hypothetical protein
MTVDGEERRLVNAVWAELTTADPDIVASLYQESPVHEIALLCLKSEGPSLQSGGAPPWTFFVGQCLASSRLSKQDFGG